MVARDGLGEAPGSFQRDGRALPPEEGSRAFGLLEGCGAIASEPERLRDIKARLTLEIRGLHFIGHGERFGAPGLPSA